MLPAVKQCFQSDVQLLSVGLATRQPLAVLNSKNSVSYISRINGEMFCCAKSRFLLGGGYAQLHANTADLLIRLNA